MELFNTKCCGVGVKKECHCLFDTMRGCQEMKEDPCNFWNGKKLLIGSESIFYIVSPPLLLTHVLKNTPVIFSCLKIRCPMSSCFDIKTRTKCFPY